MTSIAQTKDSKLVSTHNMAHSSGGKGKKYSGQFYKIITEDYLHKINK